MNVQQIIEATHKAGISLSTEDGQLIVSGRGEKDVVLTPELRHMLQKFKPKLIRVLQPKTHVLKLVIDNKSAVCIDPNSFSEDEAIESQRKRWGERLKEISCINVYNYKVD